MSVLSAPTLLSPLLHTYNKNNNNNIKSSPSSLSARPLLLSTSSSSSSSSSSFPCVSSASSFRRKALDVLICDCGVQGRDDSAASTSREDDDTTLNASAELRGAGIEEVLDNKVGDSMLNNNLEKRNIDKPDSVPIFPNRGTGRRIAVASTIAAVGLFVSTRLEFGVSLKDLSANATPYEEAIANGMPTVVEFYADWCEVCRELAPDIYKVENQYKDRVNFVMMNVDNTKWEQELDEFGVEGIPHFVFLDKEGNEEGNIVGRLPKQYFLENVDALARGETSVPYSRVTGQYSSAEARKVHQVVDPRSHG